MTTAHRPLRSCLYMPGANMRAMEKAAALPADCLIFDLEDAVAPGEKDTARPQVERALGTHDYGRRLRVVRANHIESPWAREDIAMAVWANADALLFPKVCTASDIAAIDAAMNNAGAAGSMAMWVMIEMPRAIAQLDAIAACARDTRLAALVLGSNDLAKETGMQTDAPRTAFQPVLSALVMAARAHGLAALDGVYNDIGDSEGLTREAAQGRMFGFDGKTAIHPSQLATCNRAFAPSDAEIAGARAIVMSFALPENENKGVLRVEGKMVERLHLDMAKSLLAKAEAVAEMDGDTRHAVEQP